MRQRTDPKRRSSTSVRLLSVRRKQRASYASSLAAASLQGIGLWRATDVIGGFKAWREAGLPIAHAD